MQDDFCKKIVWKNFKVFERKNKVKSTEQDVAFSKNISTDRFSTQMISVQMDAYELSVVKAFESNKAVP